MSESTRCPSCGGRVPQPVTGRPRIYCSARCKKRAERRRDRDAESRSREQAALVSGVPFEPDPGSLCHVCSRNTATVGTPRPVLCAVCATPPAQA